MLIVAAGLAFVVSLVSLRILLGAFGAFALDRPNERSLHVRPVPRTGGIAILAGAAVSLRFGAGQLWALMTLAFMLAAFSFLDDLRGIPAGLRLSAHLAACIIAVWYILNPANPAMLALLAVAATWVLNAYNFMDGSDGFAGGMSVVGYGTFALAAWLAGHFPLTALSLTIATASLAFLIYNFPSAKIFLGDVGSVPLGFLAGALGILGWENDVWPLWFPLLVFGPFIGDASITLLRRAIRGERVWQAHRDHYYQRMVRMGFGHRGTALIGYFAMAMCAAASLLGRGQSWTEQLAAFGVASAVLAMMAAWIDLRWMRSQRQSTKIQ